MACPQCLGFGSMVFTPAMSVEICSLCAGIGKIEDSDEGHTIMSTIRSQTLYRWICPDCKKSFSVGTDDEMQTIKKYHYRSCQDKLHLTKEDEELLQGMKIKVD